MNNGEISITQALNQVQSWLNAGEHEKVLQGCQEILNLDPGNLRALALLRQADELKHAATLAEMKANPTPPTAAPMTTEIEEEEKEALDPLANLSVETPAPTPTPAPPEPKPEHPFPWAMAIPAILVVLIGGGIITTMVFKNQQDLLNVEEAFPGSTIEDSVPDPSQDLVKPIQNEIYLDQNKERVEALTAMKASLEAYHKTNGDYPSVSEVEKVLSAQKDPRSNEKDKAGRPFGYVYAVYSSDTKTVAYVLSALFEDSKGFGYPWTQGANIKVHPDYRDLSKDNVVMLGSTEPAKK
jgi:hypothetical protein